MEKNVKKKVHVGENDLIILLIHITESQQYGMNTRSGIEQSRKFRNSQNTNRYLVFNKDPISTEEMIIGTRRKLFRKKLMD